VVSTQSTTRCPEQIFFFFFFFEADYEELSRRKRSDERWYGTGVGAEDTGGDGGEKKVYGIGWPTGGVASPWGSEGDGVKATQDRISYKLGPGQGVPEGSQRITVTAVDTIF
jgi:hypothetical protein